MKARSNQKNQLKDNLYTLAHLVFLKEGVQTVNGKSFSLSDRGFRVYMYMCIRYQFYKDRQLTYNESYSDIAGILNWSQSKVRRSIKELVEQGLVTILNKNDGFNNEYEVWLPFRKEKKVSKVSQSQPEEPPVVDYHEYYNDSEEDFDIF